MRGGEVPQTRRKFHAGARLQPAPLIGAQPRPLDSRPLTCNPVQMPESERRRFTPRAAPRNGDAYAAVAVHAQQVSPGARVPDEIERDVRRCDGCGGCGGCRWFCAIPEWKAQLHDDRIPEQW